MPKIKIEELFHANCPNLFLLMARRGITQKQLAADIEISQGNIADWKSGRKFPSVKALIKIALYLNVSIDYLVGISRDDSPPKRNKN